MIAATCAAIIGLLALIVLLWPGRRSPERHATRATERASPVLSSLPDPVEPVVRRPAPLQPTPQPQPKAQAVATAAFVDLFQEPAPELISTGHQIVASGRSLDPKRLKETYEYGKQHPGDARPYLIMAQDSMNRGWYAFAAGHYENAAKQDPRAKQDPNILHDLVFIAGRQHDYQRAQQAIVEFFGSDAIPSVSAALEEASTAGDTAKADRLQELLSRLPQR